MATVDLCELIDVKWNTKRSVTLFEALIKKLCGFDKIFSWFQKTEWSLSSSVSQPTEKCLKAADHRLDSKLTQKKHTLDFGVQNFDCTLKMSKKDQLWTKKGILCLPEWHRDS